MISLPWVIISIPKHFLLARGVAMNILEAALLSNTTSAARLSEPNEQANRHAHPSALFTFAVSPSSATCNAQASCTKSMAMAWVLQRLLLLVVGSAPSLVVTPQYAPSISPSMAHTHLWVHTHSTSDSIYELLWKTTTRTGRWGNDRDRVSRVKTTWCTCWVINQRASHGQWQDAVTEAGDQRGECEPIKISFKIETVGLYPKNYPSPQAF